ncbi:MAG TPA: zf-HC2 domain-containing protein [archaeon]|nr:zf-HC2 domain-containing protein [archaeon]
MSSFSAYLEGELDKDTLSSCEAHLDQCSKCSRLVSAYRIGAARLTELPELQVPEDLFERVRSADNRVRKAQVIPWRRPLVWVPAAAAAVVAAVLTFSLFLPKGGTYSLENLARENPTMDVVNMHILEHFSHPDRKGASDIKARLVSYTPGEESLRIAGGFYKSDEDDEVALSYGVSRHPVIILSGVAALED